MPLPQKPRKNVARRRNRLRRQRQVVCLHWWGRGGRPPCQSFCPDILSQLLTVAAPIGAPTVRKGWRRAPDHPVRAVGAGGRGYFPFFLAAGSASISSNFARIFFSVAASSRNASRPSY